MSKLTLNDVTSGFASAAAVNANNAAIEAAFENTLSRDGSGPNQMEANIDMNGHMLLNLGNPITVGGLNWEGPWVTSIPYDIGDMVEFSSSSYICVEAHTSGTFATDLANAKWQVVASAASLPSQVGKAFYLLATNGADALWVEANSYTHSLLAASDASEARNLLGLNSYAPATVPVYSSGDNIIYEYHGEASSDNVIDTSGNRAGLFSDYDCVGSKVIIAQFNESQAATSGGGFRDLMFLDVVDTDSTNYTAIGQKVTNGIRSFVQGKYASGAWQPMYKDLVGAYFAASGNVQWDARGTSAITCDAYQYGTGIASNEFAVHNPDSTGGGQAQSKSMAAVQAIIRSRYADEDSTHVSRGAYICSNGKRITSAIDVLSDTSEGYTSHFKFGLRMKDATVSHAAIVMPASGSGNTGTVIEYDTNDYTGYDRANNRFTFTIGAVTPFMVNSTGVNLATSAAPAAPVNGDMWFDGTNLKIRIGGVTKTVTVT